MLVLRYVSCTQLSEECPFTKPDASLSRVERSLLGLAEEEIARFASASPKKGLG